jgi:4-aminobutyrate aminotransferase
MIGVELVKDKRTKVPAEDETDQVVNECFKRGLIILPCGLNSMRFSPPLSLKETEADIALDIFAEALADVEKA